MPQLATRTDHEHEIAALLLLLFATARDEAIDLLGDPPRAANIPRSFYSGLKQQVTQAIQPTLAAIHLDAGLQLAEQLGHAPNIASLESQAQAWATQRASQLAQELAQRIEQAVGEAVSSAYQAGDLASLEVLAATGVIFAVGRAETIAVTETTGAISAGESSVVRDIERETGVRISAAWETEKDDRVCEICSPLDGTDESEWGLEFPSGPPAHGNCRCALSWSVEGEAVFSEN